MLMLLSPAKKLDYETPAKTTQFTVPDLMDHAEYLVGKLQKKSAKQLGKMMDLSANLSDLNHQRFQKWSTPFTTDNSKQALLAFKGDVYVGLDAESFSEADFEFAQQHLRILSGLHGLLRPLDLIQPYRLEMGTNFAVTPKKKNLYAYWNDTIHNAVNEAIAAQGDNVLLNLASGEYFKAVKAKNLDARIVNVNFKDYKNGQYKPVFLWVKQARGAMAQWVIKNQIQRVDDLPGFDMKGYYFSEPMSSENELVFLRDKPE